MQFICAVIIRVEGGGQFVIIYRAFVLHRSEYAHFPKCAICPHSNGTDRPYVYSKLPVFAIQIRSLMPMTTDKCRVMPKMFAQLLGIY